MKKVSLTHGKVALVDDEDYPSLSCYKWYTKKGRYTFYAAHDTGDKHNRKTEPMHRVILGLRPGDKQHTDHIDGNGLNNQRDNLRICTIAQNIQSSRKRKMNSSKHKGVGWYPAYGKWRSRICVNRKKIHLGYFDFETDAATAYNQAALKHFGEFALLNTL